MDEKKMTKRDKYELVKGVLENSDVEDRDMLIEFVEKQIDMIDTKAEKAKARAAAKKEAGDELRATIKSVLTNEYQSADEITQRVAIEGVTRAKVIARLGQLVKLGEVEKADAKTEDNRTFKVYRLTDGE